MKKPRLDSLVDRQRLWTWTFWAWIVAFEARGLFLTGKRKAVTEITSS